MGADSLFQFRALERPEEICRLALWWWLSGTMFPRKTDAQILHLKEILGARIEKLDTPEY